MQGTEKRNRSGSHGLTLGTITVQGLSKHSHKGVTAQENEVVDSVPWTLVELEGFCDCVF